MGKLFLYAIIVVLLTTCKKDSGATFDEVSYEVILINANTWSGGYLDENAVTVEITDKPGNFKYTFKNKNKICCLYIEARPDLLLPIHPNKDAVIRIYVNSRIVRETKYTVSPAIHYQF